MKKLKLTAFLVCIAGFLSIESHAFGPRRCTPSGDWSSVDAFSYRIEVYGISKGHMHRAVREARTWAP